MNELTAVVTTTPDGTDECAKFTIDTVSNPFTFHNVTQSGTDYMLSFHIKSESSGSITIANKTIDTSTTWNKSVISFTGSGTDLVLTFNTTGTYYMYHTMLEIGNVASDWHLAEEDTISRIKNAESNIKLLSDSIDMTVKKGDLISQIHVEAGKTKIMADDIDLDGYVTITDLKQTGTTTINGGNITTGMIRSQYTTVINGEDVSKFYVDLNNGFVHMADGEFTGSITSTSGTIGGWTIKDTALYSGTTSMSSTVNGTYIGTDGIRNYASSVQYVNIANGVLTAYGANINGTIVADSGTIGGWTIKDNSLENTYTTTVDSVSTSITLSLNNSANGSQYFMSVLSSETTGSSGDTSEQRLFSIDKLGSVYMTSGMIGGWNIEKDKLYSQPTDNTYVALHNATNSTQDVLVVRTGTSDAYEYPFWIRGDGSVYMTKGLVGGFTIDESSLSYSGSDFSMRMHRYYGIEAYRMSSSTIEDDSRAILKDGGLYIGSAFELTTSMQEKWDTYTNHITSITQYVIATKNNIVFTDNSAGLSGLETIASGAIGVPRELSIARLTSSNNVLIGYSTTDNPREGGTHIYAVDGDIRLFAGDGTATEELRMTYSSTRGFSLAPVTAGNGVLGTSTLPFYNLYLSHCIYYTSPPTGSGTAVYINSNGAIVKYSSDRRLKNSIAEVTNDELNPERLYDLPIWQYKYNADALEDGDDLYGKDVIGFMADEVCKIYPRACAYDKDGIPTSWNPNVMIPAMLQLIKNQKAEIDELSKCVKQLISIIS